MGEIKPLFSWNNFIDRRVAKLHGFGPRRSCLTSFAFLFFDHYFSTSQAQLSSIGDAFEYVWLTVSEPIHNPREGRWRRLWRFWQVKTDVVTTDCWLSDLIYSQCSGPVLNSMLMPLQHKPITKLARGVRWKCLNVDSTACHVNLHMV